jgi:hypothetical protein
MWHAWERNEYTLLRKRPLVGHERRWENNIKVTIKEVGWKAVNWTHIVQERKK